MVIGAPESARPLQVARRIATIIVAAISLGACAQFGGTATKFSEAEFGVSASPRVVNRGNIPTGGGYEHVGSPYVVAGQLYVPRENPNYSEVGYASWYGENFHGRQTANGEIYDMNRLTAAHTTLPLPSYVRVTNLENGASVVVRVNDRGPFHSDRIIDVSARAADMLGMANAGLAQVQVDYIGRASLEGDDTRMLMATYQAPGAQAATTVAYDSTARTVSATTARNGLFSQFGNRVAAAIFQPTALADDQDPLRDLLRGPQTYAALPVLTAAQQAAEQAANGVAPGDDPVLVQVGVFSERDNANAIAVILTEYGVVTVSELAGANGPMWSVRVAADAALERPTIAAAIAAGAAGAFALN